MRAVLLTAFFEGLCVLVVEIAGARALAPYFGTSLRVWTAQITATLLFLALGYGLGGMLSRRSPRMLSWVLWVAGGWLSLYPVWRAALLHALGPLGVSGGAFAASALLFGVPLLCLGAVSPLLIQRLFVSGLDGGVAAGRLFFTNTLGGLAGGWLTALVFLPHVPLRVVLAGTGVALVVLGTLWSREGKLGLHAWLLPAACATLASLGPTAPRHVGVDDPNGRLIVVRERTQSPSGSVLVLELPGSWRKLLLDGVDQGAIDLTTRTSYHPFSEYLAFAAHRYHPRAKRALLLGLGCGVLAKTLAERGLSVTVAEIEPAILRAAREHFWLPSSVRVVLEDGRAWLARDPARYDLVVLDAYAGESSPWYLLTREALESVRERLAEGGRVVLNTVSMGQGSSPGLAKLEATLFEVFGEALVYVEPRLPTEDQELVNVTLVAGRALEPTTLPYEATLSARVAPFIGDMSALPARPVRPAKAGARYGIDTDDFSTLELADAELRLRWRERIIGELDPELLQD